MSTRSCITFKDDREEFSVYRHCDGYPDGKHGVLAAIESAKEYAWPLPRFEPSDFAAAFIAATKPKGGGNVYVTGGEDCHGDLAYSYTVTCSNGQIAVETKSVR